MVADFVGLNGEWNRVLLQQLVPAHVLDKIMAIRPPDELRGMDYVAWALTNDGVFTVSSAYDAIA